MKISVENFGAISKAEVDLNKDLIILTGENNTGKTYLAYLIYNVFNPFFDEKDNFWSYVGDLDDPGYFFQNDVLKINLSEFFQNEISKNLIGLLLDRFSVKPNFFSDTKLNILYEKNDSFVKKINELELVVKDYSLNSMEDAQRFTVSVQKNRGTSALKIKNLNGKNNPAPLPESINIAKVLISNSVLNSTFLIPAERQGINLFHKELAVIKNKVFDKLLKNPNNELLKFLQTRFNQYSKPIRDALETVQNLDAIQKNKSEFAYLADELEKSFLKGNVFISAEGDIKYRPKVGKKNLDIHMTSSTVKSLATLSLYLRHIAKKGDFLIIDEPELNLHPDNQRKIAQFIARLINQGFKVMISTHSEYILREINNLIALNTGLKNKKEEGEGILKEYGYQKNQLLAPEQVGVYLFKQGEDVESVQITDTGFSIETIDKVTNEMIDTTNNILFTLHDY